jgi:hypothetical protein
MVMYTSGGVDMEDITRMAWSSLVGGTRKSNDSIKLTVQRDCRRHDPSSLKLDFVSGEVLVHVP